MHVGIRSKRKIVTQRRSFQARLIFVTIATLAAVTISSKIATARAFSRHASVFVGASASSKSLTAAAAANNRFDLFKRGFKFGTQRFRDSATASSTATMASTKAYDISTNMRGLFAGSGVEGLSNPLINEQVLNLLPPEKRKNTEDVKVLYLGTATYDIALFREKQTRRFLDKGCEVSHLDVANSDIDIDESASAIRSADVLLVGGGNTLFAVDRWNHLGLVSHMREAMERGCILTGGSAGAICWFDSGHSDSADPETYKEAMLNEYSNENSKKEDESSDYDPLNKKEWKYLRCPGLGFVPGPMVCCPHHDKVQSNGLLRAHDFDKMLLARAKSSQKSVLGIGIDHYSAFVVEGNDYKIYAIPEKPGSVSINKKNEGFFDVSEDGTPNGKPGVWIKRVIVDETNNDLCVEAMVCPPSGKVTDLLAYGGDNLPCQNNEEHDENQAAVDLCRKENPSGRQF